GDVLTYRFVGHAGDENGDYNGLFAIDPNTGVISFANADLMPDITSDVELPLFVEVSDGNGGTVTREVIIRIDADEAPPNEAPTNIGFTDSIVRENMGQGNIIGRFFATDADALTWTLVDDADGR